MNQAPAVADTSFRGKLFLRTLWAVYSLLWIVTALRPFNRKDWFLENILVFVALPVLALTYRRFRFSNFSYALVVAFLSLHAVGAHYTYSEMPVGNWLRDGLHLSRNHYDRAVHFCFGLLLAYPLHEVVVRALNVRSAWSYPITVHVVLAWSAAYELLEALVAFMVSPDLGAAYNGIQGDVWDSQKDMACALAGALICMGLKAAFPQTRNSVPPRKCYPPV